VQIEPALPVDAGARAVTAVARIILVLGIGLPRASTATTPAVCDLMQGLIAFHQCRSVADQPPVLDGIKLVLHVAPSGLDEPVGSKDGADFGLGDRTILGAPALPKSLTCHGAPGG